jgi:uncharacterized membrane protein
MDLAMLGSALTSRKTDRARVLGSMGAVLGVTALDAFTGVQLSRERMGLRADRAMRVTRAITVQRPIDEVYRFWRDFKNLPRFMAHLVTVHVRDEKTSHWVASGPAGTTVEWDAEIVADRPNEMIAWRSLEGADVSNSGTVRFTRAPGGQATEIHLELHYDPPAGRLGVSIAKLFGKEPGQQVNGDLHRFKQVLEIGEVVHSDASIHRGLHPARPAGERTGSYRREGGRR